MTPKEAKANNYRCPVCNAPLEVSRWLYYCPACIIGDTKAILDRYPVEGDNDK